MSYDEPIITGDELAARQEQVVQALHACLRNQHAKIAITSSEAMAALAMVMHDIATNLAQIYYEIKSGDWRP